MTETLEPKADRMEPEDLLDAQRDAYREKRDDIRKRLRRTTLKADERTALEKEIARCKMNLERIAVERRALRIKLH